MGLFDWLSRKNAKPSTAAGTSSFNSDGASGFDPSRLTAYPGVLVRPPDDSGGPDTESGHRIRQASAQAKARADERRNQRNTYRELLHQVVRESMVRAGMISASYKFKVLSLDAKGRSFLVMMDLPAEFARQIDRLSDIEEFILSSARSRYQLEVSSVYWRVLGAGATSTAPAAHDANAVSVSVPNATSETATQPVAAPVATAPAAASAAASATTTPSAVSLLKPAPPVAASRATASTGRPQPVLADEVAALKAALAAGASSAAANAAASAKFGAVTAAMAAVSPVAEAKPKSDKGLLLTGFEETEMADDDNYPVLGSTQYGDLR